MKGSKMLRRLAVVCIVVMVAALAANCKKSSSSNRKPGPGPGTPQITLVNPITGDVAGGDSVTIVTANFQDDFLVDPPTVLFGTVPATAVTPITTTTVMATTPPHAAGAVDVQVDSTGTVQSAVLAGGFTYMTAPPCSIVAVTPGQGYFHQTTMVLIDGGNFDTAPAPTVEFGAGNFGTNVTALSSSQLRVTAPTAAGPGFVDVIVTNQADSCSLPSGFEYISPPSCTVTSVTPNQGADTGGVAALIQGTNFELTPIPTVEFGAGNPVNPMNVSVLDTTRISVVTPPGNPGFVNVIVTTTAGSCTLTSGYEYLPPPTCSVTSVSPNFAPEFGGSWTSVYGTDFTPLSRVWLGATEVTSVTYVSMTQLDVRVPAGTGTVDVMVDIGGGITCTLPGGFTYIGCTGGCNLQNVSPNTGGPTDVVTLSGTGFETGAMVFFGNAPNVVEATVQSYAIPNAIDVIVPNPPPGGGTVDVEVVNPSGSCCSRNNAFTYASTGCNIGSLSRTSGPSSGGQTMSISGTGFVASPLPEVWFGSEQAIVGGATSIQIMLLTPPANGQTTVDVTVVNSGGGSCTCFGCYTFGGCLINVIAPNSGGTNGGDLVVISGSGFDPVSLKVEVNAIIAEVLSFSTTQISFITPPSAVGGPVDIRVFNETLISQCTAAGGFTYTLPGGGPCTITSIAPASGCTGGGETVLINGTGFDAATGVLFGEGIAPSVIYDPIGGGLTVVTPPWFGMPPPGAVNVVVAPQNRDPATRVNGFSYYDLACPGGCTISAVTPSSGPVSGGNTITITGSNFCACGGGVSFMPMGQQGLVTYINSSTLEVVVPASMTGADTVDVIYGDSSLCSAPCVACYTYQ